MKWLAFCLILSLGGGHAQAESAAPTLPKLSQAQMLADFDQAIGFIDAFAVHKDLNALRLGIDYPGEYARLRSMIDEGTDACEFKRIFGRALNLVQDLHASYMDHGYLTQYGKLQSRFNIGDDESYSSVAAFDQGCPATSAVLELPMMFINGRYVVYADFSYQGTTVKRGAEVIRYNGQAIAAFIRSNFDSVWPARVTPAGDIYSLKFYRAGEPEFRLGLADGRELKLNLTDSVEWTTPRKREATWSSQTEARVLHFPEQRVLYIGIPMMDESFVETINAEVDNLVKAGAKFDRIAIDIRGNGGGSDMTWRRVLSHLLGRKLQLALDLRMKDSELARKRYPQEAPAPAESVAMLGGAKYRLHNGNLIEWEPDADSLNFTGPIYVLRDDYIYSSAGNLASFAGTDPQLVSVGSTTDVVGGAQLEPLFFKLDHSGLVFRIEPALDFSAVKGIDDLAHNHVEVEIERSIDDLYLRSTFDGDIYGRDFLLNHDPLFRYVVLQSSEAD